MKTAILCILLVMTACQRPAAAPNSDATLATTGGEAPVEEPETPVTIEFPRNSLSCDTSGVEAVRTWMTAYYAWQDAGTDADGAYDLVHAERDWSAAKAARQPFMVHIAPRGLKLNGIDVKPVCGADPEPEKQRGPFVKIDCFADGYATAVERSKREAKLLGVAWTEPKIALAIADNTPWSKVVETIEVLASLDLSAAYLAFHGVWPAELEPPPDALLEEIRAHFSLGADHADSPRPTRGKGCVALDNFMEEMMRITPEQRDAVVAAQLGEVWVECKCETDIEWQVGLLGGEDKPVVLVAKTWEAGGTSVSHPAATEWSDIAAMIVETNAPIAARVE